MKMMGVGLGYIRELLRELDADIPSSWISRDKAVKSRMLRICEEGFGHVQRRPNVRRTQQLAERSAKAFVIIDDSDEHGCGATHGSTIAMAADVTAP